MADNSTIEIVIRAVTSGATSGLKDVTGSLKTLQGQTSTTGAAMKSTATEVDSFASRLGGLAVKIGGVLLGFEAFNQSARMMASVIRSGIDDIDAMTKLATNMAIIMTSLAKTPGPNTFAQSLQYSTAVVEELRDKASQLGVQWKQMEAEMRAGADIGAFPNSDKDVQAMADIARFAAATAVSRRGDVAALAEVKQLLDGQVSTGNAIGNILATNLGVTQKHVVELLRQHLAEGDLYEFIDAHLGSVKEAYQSINNLASTQVGLLKDHLDNIQRVAEGGFYQSITNSLKGMNDWLGKNGAAIAQQLKPALDSLGQSGGAFLNDMIARLPEMTAMFSTALQVTKGIVDTLDFITRNVIDLGSTIRDHMIQPFIEAAQELGRLVGIASTSLQGFGPGVSPTQRGPWNDPRLRGAAQQVGAMETKGVTGSFGQPSFGPNAGGTGGSAAGQTMAQWITSMTGAAFPAHPAVRTTQIGADTGSHGPKASESVKEGADATADWVRMQEALAGAIDDATARQQRLVDITKQAIAAYQKEAAAAATTPDQREGIEQKIADLQVELVTRSIQLIKTANDQKLQSALDYLAQLKAANSISADDEIAYYGRILASYTLTTQQRTQILNAQRAVEAAARKQDATDIQAQAQGVLADFQAEVDQRKALGQESLDDEISDKTQEIQLAQLLGQSEKDLDAMRNQLAVLQHQRHLQAITDINQEYQAQVTQIQQTASQALSGIGSSSGTQGRNDRIAILEQEETALEKLRDTWLQALQAAAQNTDEYNKVADAVKGVTAAIVETQDAINKARFDDLEKATQSITQTVQTSFATALDNILTGTKSFSVSMRDMFRSIGDSILKEITTALSQSLVGALNIGPTIRTMLSSLPGIGGKLFPTGAAPVSPDTQTQHDSTMLFQRAVTDFATAVGTKSGGGSSAGATDGFMGAVNQMLAAAGVNPDTASVITNTIRGFGNPTLGAMMGSGTTAGASGGILGMVTGLFGGGNSGGSAGAPAGGSSMNTVLGLVGTFGKLLHIPGFASGGIVSSPTLAMVGESGPEAVIPLKGGGVPLSGGGGGTVHVHIHAWDTVTGRDQLAKHADYLGDLLMGGASVNSPLSRAIGNTPGVY